jgi:membrane-associated phospholipid phosphatase
VGSVLLSFGAAAVGFGAARALTTTYVPVLLALACDLVIARRRPIAPSLALLTLASVIAGSTLANVIKPLFDRPRPPRGHAGISAVGNLPATASFPSGHATTAFAAAAAIAVAQPALRVWALALAAIVAISRVYLGMHYLRDVLAGALLGSAIGAGIVLAGRRALSEPSSLDRGDHSGRGAKHLISTLRISGAWVSVLSQTASRQALPHRPRPVRPRSRNRAPCPARLRPR